MQDEQSPSDKPFDPSPRKLEEAREKGEIVRSQDLNTAVVYVGFLLVAATAGAWSAQSIGTLLQVLLGQAHTLAPLILEPGGSAVAGGIIGSSFLVFLVASAVPGILLLIALIGQRAVIFAPSKLAPKLSRIAPFLNAKQKFGAQGLFQFAKSTVKLITVSALLSVYLVTRADIILLSLYAEPGQIIAALGQLVFDFMAVIALLSLIIGGVDWMWEWTQHQNKNRMSHQEVVDEMKSSEGDPQMKQQRRQKAQSIAMNQMLGDVSSSDVVIVNPTHYAVALKWDRKGGGVPTCTAKGVDELARKIREIAAENGVPIFRDPPTARILHASIDIGSPITSDQFKAVAAAIRFADLMRAKVKKARV